MNLPASAGETERTGQRKTLGGMRTEQEATADDFSLSVRAAKFH